MQHGVKRRLSVLLINSMPRCTAKELKICVHKTHVYGSIIHISQKEEMA